MAAWRRAKGEDPGPPTLSRRDKPARHAVTNAAVTPNATAVSQRDNPECHAVTNAMSRRDSHDSRPVPSLPVPKEQEASRVPAHMSVPAREAVPVAVVSPPAASSAAPPLPGPRPTRAPSDEPIEAAGRALRVAWAKAWQEHVGELAPAAGTSAIETAGPWLVDYQRRCPERDYSTLAAALMAGFFAAKHAGAKAKGRARSRPRVEWLLEDPGRYLEGRQAKAHGAPTPEREAAIAAYHRDVEDRALLRGKYAPRDPEPAAERDPEVARFLERAARTLSSGPVRLGSALGGATPQPKASAPHAGSQTPPRLDPFRPGGALGPPLDPEEQRARLRAQADALRAQLANATPEAAE